MAMADQKRSPPRRPAVKRLFYSRAQHPLESIAADNPQDQQFPTGWEPRDVELRKFLVA